MPHDEIKRKLGMLSLALASTINNLQMFEGVAYKRRYDRCV